MDNIIQSISQKVKREIEKDVIKVLEGGLNLDSIVDSVGIMVNDIAQITLSTIINEISEFVKESPERSKNYHVQRNNDKRTLITRFGELKFERTYYKNIIDNSYVYILDKLLGIEKYERVEGNLKGDILDKAVDVSYEKAAKLSTPVPLTRETVKKIIRENGVIDNLELEVKEKKK